MATTPQRGGKQGKKYSRELVLSAIQAVEDGNSMSSVAKEVGVRPNTVKYWVDHKDNYLGEKNTPSELSFEDGLDEQTRQRFHRLGWGIVFAAMRAARSKFKDSSLPDITRFIEVSVDRLGKFGRAPQVKGKNASGEDAPPKAEQDRALVEIRTMVAKFVGGSDAGIDSKDNQRGTGAEPATPTPPAPEEPIDTTAEPSKDAAKGEDDAAAS